MNLYFKKVILPWHVIIVLAISLLVIGGCSTRSSEAPKESVPQKEASAPSEPKQEQKPVTIRLAGAMPATYITSRAISEVVIPAIEKNSNGQIKVEFYPAGQLFVDKDLVQAVINGSVEMMHNSFNWWSAQDKAAAFHDVPFLFKDSVQFRAAMEGKIGAELGKIVDENGAKILGWVNIGIIDAMGTKSKQIKKPEDLQGLRMRVSGDIQVKSLNALGATPVSISSSEAYMALQRGTADGIFSAADSFVTRKWVELVKYLTFVPLSFMSQDVSANPKWWNSLSPEQQKIIQDAVKKGESWSFEESDKAYDEAVANIKKAGVEIYKVPPEELKLWQDKEEPVYDYYRQAGGNRAANLMEMTKE